MSFHKNYTIYKVTVYKQGEKDEPEIVELTDDQPVTRKYNSAKRSSSRSSSSSRSRSRSMPSAYEIKRGRFTKDNFYDDDDDDESPSPLKQRRSESPIKKSKSSSRSRSKSKPYDKRPRSNSLTTRYYYKSSDKKKDDHHSNKDKDRNR